MSALLHDRSECVMNLNCMPFHYGSDSVMDLNYICFCILYQNVFMIVDFLTLFHYGTECAMVLNYKCSRIIDLKVIGSNLPTLFNSLDLEYVTPVIISDHALWNYTLPMTPLNKWIFGFISHHLFSVIFQFSLLNG